MLIQRAGTGTLPPPGFTTPPWASLVTQWAQETPPLSEPTATLGPATVTLGHDDSEADDFHPDLARQVDGHEFGWDNESPPRYVEVRKFMIDWRPISNAEFLDFWKGEGSSSVSMPKSWVNEHNGIKVIYSSLSHGFPILNYCRSVRSMDPSPWILQRTGQF